MFRSLTSGFVLTILMLAVQSAAADDKKEKDKPTIWTRDANGVELKFEMSKDTAKYHVSVGDNGCTVTAKLKVEKGVVTSEVTDVEVKGNFPDAPKKGSKMTYKWVVKGDTATLSDLTGEGTEGAKDVIEGEYKMKK